jgi:antitoxin HigA-1
LDVLPTLGMNEGEAASELKVKQEELHDILTCQRRVDAEWALRLGRFCGNGPSLWMDMQGAVDLWYARRHIGEVVDTIRTHKPER